MDTDHLRWELLERIARLERQLQEEREVRRSCLLELWDATHALQRAAGRLAEIVDAERAAIEAAIDLIGE